MEAQDPQRRRVRNSSGQLFSCGATLPGRHEGFDDIGWIVGQHEDGELGCLLLG